MAGLLFAAACLGSAACSAPAPPEAPTPRPDVLLVSIDSLRADHLGSYGYGRETSPTIDRLAGEGVRFDQAVSSSSWTLPAHAALFTGLEEQAHGLTANGLRLADAQFTLAERLGAAGYRTAGIFAGPYLDPEFGLGQGFEAYEDCSNRRVDLDPDVRHAAAAESDASHRGETGTCTLDRFDRLLADPDPRPAFFFVHLWDVHYDYDPPAPWDRRFDPDYRGTTDFSHVATNDAIHAGMADVDREHLVALYDGEIGWTDSVLGRLLESHARARAGRERVVVVLADHGEEFFEHGGKGHQRTLFEEVVRIPLIVVAPRRWPAGTSVDGLARIVDVLPTVLELAGAPTAEPVEGRSLAPLARGETLPPRPALLWLRADPNRPLVALRRERGKIVLGFAPALPSFFDLADDPGELRPLHAASALERAGLPELRRRVAEAGRYLERNPDRRPVGASPDEELARELVALGYLDARAR